MKKSGAQRVAYWATTSFFALWMAFTAYAQLCLPVVRQMFTHLGFPDYFRIELSLAKIVGILILLFPVPPQVKEWAYSGFAITLSSALIAHLSVGDSPAVFMWRVVAGVVLGLSYFFYSKTSREPSAVSLLPDGATSQQ
jgi:hypothetical protein